MDDLAGKNAHVVHKDRGTTDSEKMQTDLGLGARSNKRRGETGAAAHVGHYGTAGSAFVNPADQHTAALGNQHAESEHDKWEGEQWENAQRQASNSILRARDVIRAGMVARGLRFQDGPAEGSNVSMFAY